MTTQTKAPDFPGGREGQESGYPSKGRKLGPAWQQIWNTLSLDPALFMDGKMLAETVAPVHDLVPATLVALMSRAARAGLLDKETRDVKVQVILAMRNSDKVAKVINGTRSRVFYRIADHG